MFIDEFCEKAYFTIALHITFRAYWKKKKAITTATINSTDSIHWGTHALQFNHSSVGLWYDMAKRFGVVYLIFKWNKNVLSETLQCCLCLFLTYLNSVSEFWERVSHPQSVLWVFLSDLGSFFSRETCSKVTFLLHRAPRYNFLISAMTPQKVTRLH